MNRQAFELELPCFGQEGRRRSHQRRRYCWWKRLPPISSLPPSTATSGSCSASRGTNWGNGEEKRKRDEIRILAEIMKMRRGCHFRCQILKVGIILFTPSTDPIKCLVSFTSNPLLQRLNSFAPRTEEPNSPFGLQA